ncbi:kinase-like domain-containing protein [Thelonectria olida]|uniref:Kinase-like domain-containing protein n=1 Tax=Thelonectria olida TaxID=1576542 RepID=A0A9P8W2Q2_9HYPO|nr:kinase-like domain-containing protein [Thelonectria olida]
MSDEDTKSILPAVPEEVTAEWLSSVLKLKVKSIELTKSVLNATASKLFFTLTYEDDEEEADRPTHVCLKGGFNPAMLAIESYREILITMYSRETSFFNLVAPKLVNMTLPKVWWAGVNSAQGQAILVMDDLNHQGYTFGDPVEDWSVERVKKGVEQLAALHAGTWGWTLESHPWIIPAYEHVMIGLTMMWEASVFGEDRPPFPEVIKNQARTQAALKKHFATKNPRFSCQLHGDPHTGNTFLDKDERPFFLDWQTMHLGSAFHDFAYFVVGALSVEDRRAHELEILEHYVNYLTKFGVEGVSIDDEDVVKEYHKCCMSGLGWVLTPYDMQGRERVWAMCERYCAAIVDHKTIELVESLPEPESA